MTAQSIWPNLYREYPHVPGPHHTTLRALTWGALPTGWVSGQKRTQLNNGLLCACWRRNLFSNVIGQNIQKDLSPLQIWISFWKGRGAYQIFQLVIPALHFYLQYRSRDNGSVEATSWLQISRLRYLGNTCKIYSYFSPSRNIQLPQPANQPPILFHMWDVNGKLLHFEPPSS